MRKQKKLIIRQLDKKSKPLLEFGTYSVPEKGWINALRTSLNITLEQAGKKIGSTRQDISGAEKREAAGSITLNKLNEIASAIDLKLVYGLVPKDGSYEKLIDRKAKQLAEKIIRRTNQNMQLENQGIKNRELLSAIKELTEELKREIPSSLWD